jgi:hypothetical protein
MRTTLFCLTIATAMMGYSPMSSADDTAPASNTTDQQTTPQKHHHHGFRMGVCVGRTLGGTPGEKPDPTAFKAAVESCRAKFKNKEASSAPSNS